MTLTLARGEDEVQRYIREISRDALQLHPPGGGWSRQQVVEHLIMTYRLTAEQFDRRWKEDALPQRKPALMQKVFQVLMLRVGVFPPGRKAPEFAMPELSELPPMDGSSLAATFHMHLHEVAELIDRAEAKWGSSVRVATHPIIGALTAEQWRRFHALHALHHAKQLERIQGALEAS